MKVRELLEMIKETKGCSCCIHMRVVDVFHDGVYMCTREKEPFTIGDLYYSEITNCELWSIDMDSFDDSCDEIDEDLEDLGVKITKEAVNANTTD